MENKLCKKEFSNLGFRMLVGAVWITAVQLISQSVVLGNRPEWIDNMNIVLAVSMIPLYVIGYPLTFLIVKKKDGKKIEKHRMGPGQFVLAFMMDFPFSTVIHIFILVLVARQAPT